MTTETKNEPRYYEVIVKVIVTRDSVMQAAQDVNDWMHERLSDGKVRSLRVLSVKDIDDQIMGGTKS